MARWISSTFKGGNYTTSLCSLFWCLANLTVKCLFFFFNVFQCVSIASHPVPGCHWEESGSIVFIHYPKIGCLNTLIRFPPKNIPFSVLSSPSSLSLSVYTRCCKPLMFMALCPSHCSRNPSSLEKPSTRHGTPDVMRRGEDLLIQPAGNALPNAAQDTVGLGHKGTLLPQVNTRTARTLQVLLHKATFQPVSPQLVLVGSMLCLLSAGGRQCITFLSSLGTGISQKEVFVNESLWREAVHCTDVYMMPPFKGISNNSLNLLLYKHLITQNFTILTVSTVKFLVCCMHIYPLFGDSAVIINCNGYTLNNIQDFQER